MRLPFGIKLPKIKFVCSINYANKRNAIHEITQIYNFCFIYLYKLFEQEFIVDVYYLNSPEQHYYYNYKGCNLHSAVGLATYDSEGKAGVYYLNGIYYPTKETWFAALNPQEKDVIIWEMNKK